MYVYVLKLLTVILKRVSFYLSYYTAGKPVVNLFQFVPLPTI